MKKTAIKTMTLREKIEYMLNLIEPAYTCDEYITVIDKISEAEDALVKYAFAPTDVRIGLVREEQLEPFYNAAIDGMRLINSFAEKVYKEPIFNLSDTSHEAILKICSEYERSSAMYLLDHAEDFYPKENAGGKVAVMV